MKVICLFKHHWVYTYSDRADTRLCTRCHKKQIILIQVTKEGDIIFNIIGYPLKPGSYLGLKWVDTPLSKYEERNIKLKKLGI